MKVCNLASGSRGNATLVSSANTHVLVDNGLTISELNKRLDGLLDVKIKNLAGIVITHEHSDHTKGLAKLSNKYKLPVYIHQQSLNNFCDRGEMQYLAEVDMDMPFLIGDISIEPFRLPHDSAYNLGYKMTDGKKTFALATDLGYVSDNTLSKLEKCDMVMLESNHDLKMLKYGSYPAYLKARIASSSGHLSNDECAKTLVKLVQSGTSQVLLAHLSQDNNTPELAFECAKQTLSDSGIIEGKDLVVEVASQFHPTKVIEI